MDCLTSVPLKRRNAKPLERRISMKRLFHVLPIILMFSASVLAQGGEKKAAAKKAGGNVEQTLLEIERRWAAAALKSDAAALEDILADSWSTITAEGKMQTRAQSLDN